MTKLGIYIIGARGNVGTCVAAGVLGLRLGDLPVTGCVTETPLFEGAELVSFGDIELGGCDVVSVELQEKARDLALNERILPMIVVERVSPELKELNAKIDEGIALKPGDVPQGGYRAAMDHIRNNLEAFAERSGADQVVVVNLSSTEALIELDDRHGTASAFEQALKENVSGTASSTMLYAWSAISCDMPFINFTPSQANDMAAISQFARERKVAHAGKDGKTGETLIKTALAPMFAARNFNVTSWIANNYLGNGDGKTLNDPAAREAKLASKDEALRSILGEETHLSTKIDYVPELGDWKKAVDTIEFEGFLGTPMSMHFVWRGCDSALAAPLVIDLARIVERAQRAGEYGELGYLGSFFKSPLGSGEHNLHEQILMMAAHAQSWKS